MTAPTPAEFLERHVKPPVEQWRSDPDSEWKAKVAAMALNDMAERYWHYWKDRGRSKVYAAARPKEFREALVLHECEDFQLIWDVADAHKHVGLDRGNRKVTKSSQAGPCSRFAPHDRGRTKTRTPPRCTPRNRSQ